MPPSTVKNANYIFHYETLKSFARRSALLFIARFGGTGVHTCRKLAESFPVIIMLVVIKQVVTVLVVVMLVVIMQVVKKQVVIMLATMQAQ